VESVSVQPSVRSVPPVNHPPQHPRLPHQLGCPCVCRLRLQLRRAFDAVGVRTVVSAWSNREACTPEVIEGYTQGTLRARPRVVSLYGAQMWASA